MLTRRAFSGALACGLAAAELPRIRVVNLPAATGVPHFSRGRAVTFDRAWLACPDPALAAAVLFSGRYPHSPGPALFQASQNLDPAVPVVYISEAHEDSPSEAACHIALAIQHPRIAAGRLLEFPVSTVDVAPTLLALMDLELPDGLHGRNLAGLLMAESGPHPESIYAEGRLGKPDEWRMMVRGLDKIVVRRRNLDILHLFNLGEDPTEERDLAREIGYRLKVDELRALIQAWMKRTGDGMDPSGLKRR
jgi:hypothetical protein